MNRRPATLFVPRRVGSLNPAHLAQNCYYRFGLMFAAQVAGFETAARITRGMGRFLFNHIPLFRTTMARTIGAALPQDLSPDELEAIAFEYAQCWRLPFLEAEFVHRKLHRTNLNEHVRFIGFERVIDHVQGGRGVMAAGTYFGSHQAGVTALGLLLNGQIACIVSPLQHSTQRRWMEGLVRRRLALLLPVGQAVSGALQALRNGHLVLMISEHERHSPSAIVERFAGRRQRFHPTPAVLAWRAKCPIAVVTCRRVPGAYQFEARCHDWIEAPTGKRKSWILQAAARIVRALDQAVCEDPAQFTWLRQHLVLGRPVPPRP